MDGTQIDRICLFIVVACVGHGVPLWAGEREDVGAASRSGKRYSVPLVVDPIGRRFASLSNAERHARDAQPFRSLLD